MNLVSHVTKRRERPRCYEPYPLERRRKVKGTQTSATAEDLTHIGQILLFSLGKRESKRSNAAGVSVQQKIRFKKGKRTQGYTSRSYYALEW